MRQNSTSITELSEDPLFTEPRNTQLRAYCFGNFELEVDGKRIDKWHSLKAKSLLKFLIAQKSGKPVSNDVLIELLWPDCSPEEGMNNLKATVYTLRHTLPGHKEGSRVFQPLLSAEGQYFINPEANLWVDVNEFNKHWENGRKLEQQGNNENAIKEFCLAEELYQGDYLEEDRYADWTLIQRESLKDNYMFILQRLAINSFDKHDYENCILCSQKMLLKDVCNEEAYRWIMKCHDRLGDINRVRQWYKFCFGNVKKELGIEPDAKTTNLYLEMINQNR